MLRSRKHQLRNLTSHAAAIARSVHLFAESRNDPLKTRCALPRRWGLAGPRQELRSTARPGEFFVWHVGVWSRDLSVEVRNCSLRSAQWSSTSNVDRSTARGQGVTDAAEGARGVSPGASELDLRCISIRGVGHDGATLRLNPKAPAGCARDLWFGVFVPKMLPATTRTLHLAIDLGVRVESVGDWRLSI